jgi:hypothetical protein
MHEIDFLDYQLNEMRLQIPALKLQDLKQSLLDSGRIQPTMVLNSSKINLLLGQLDYGGESSDGYPRRPDRKHPEPEEFDIADLYCSGEDEVYHREAEETWPERTPPPPPYAAPFKIAKVGVSIPLTVDTQRTKYVIPSNPNPMRPSRDCSFSASASSEFDEAFSPPTLSEAPRAPGKKITLNFVADEPISPVETPSPASGLTAFAQRKRYDSGSYMNSPTSSSGSGSHSSMYEYSTSPSSASPRVRSTPIIQLHSGSVFVIKKDPISEHCMPKRKERGSPKRKPAPRFSEGQKARQDMMSKSAPRSSTPNARTVSSSDTVELHVRIPDVKKLMKMTVERTILWEVLRQLIRKKFVEKFGGKDGKRMMEEKTLVCSKNYEVAKQGDWASCLADYSRESVIKLELA